MTDKYSIIREDYDVVTGITTVTINTHIGAFTGTTKIDDIDAKYPSMFQGCEIALSKALRKYAVAACTILKNEIKTISGMIKQAFTHASKVNHTIRILLETKKEKQKELSLWTRRVAALSDAIKARINARDVIIKRYELKATEDENK